MEERNYLKEYNEALNELNGIPPVSDEKRKILIANMEKIANDAIKDAVRKNQLIEALNEYDDYEQKKSKISGTVFISSVVAMVGTAIASKYGIDPELVNHIDQITKVVSGISGSLTFAFLTVGFSCKLLSSLLKKKTEELYDQIDRIVKLPYNNLSKYDYQDNEKQ